MSDFDPYTHDFATNMTCLFDGQLHLPESYKSENHRHLYEAFSRTKIYTKDITIGFISKPLIQAILDIFNDASNVKYYENTYCNNVHLRISQQCVENVIKHCRISLESYYNTPGWSRSLERCSISHCSDNCREPRGIVKLSNGNLECTTIFMTYLGIQYEMKVQYNGAAASNALIRCMMMENRTLQSQIDSLVNKVNGLTEVIQKMSEMTTSK